MNNNERIGEITELIRLWNISKSTELTNELFYNCLLSISYLHENYITKIQFPSKDEIGIDKDELIKKNPFNMGDAWDDGKDHKRGIFKTDISIPLKNTKMLKNKNTRTKLLITQADLSKKNNLSNINYNEKYDLLNINYNEKYEYLINHVEQHRYKISNHFLYTYSLQGCSMFGLKYRKIVGMMHIDYSNTSSDVSKFISNFIKEVIEEYRDINYDYLNIYLLPKNDSLKDKFTYKNQMYPIIKFIIRIYRKHPNIFKKFYMTSVQKIWGSLYLFLIPDVGLRGFDTIDHKKIIPKYFDSGSHMKIIGQSYNLSKYIFNKLERFFYRRGKNYIEEIKINLRYIDEKTFKNTIEELKDPAKESIYIDDIFYKFIENYKNDHEFYQKFIDSLKEEFNEEYHKQIENIFILD
jgi:hypothetical protein